MKISSLLYASIVSAVVATMLTTANSAQSQYYSSEPPAAPGGIAVSGTGEMRAKPDIVEVNLRISGNAEITDDAIVKHRDAKQRVLDAFKALKMDNIKFDEQNLGLRPGGNAQQAYQAAMNGDTTNLSKRTQIEITSNLRLRLTDIANETQEDLMKKIGKLLDVAQDSGAAIGPSQQELSMAYRYGRMPDGVIVNFIISDVAEIREKVYQLAIEDAKKRAERLARLSGVTLGSPVSIQEVMVSGESGSRVSQPWEYVAAQAEPNKGEVSSNTFSESRFQVKLMVRFGIEEKKEKTAAVR